MKNNSTSEDLPPSYKSSPAIHAAFRSANVAYVSMMQIIYHLRKIEPNVAAMVGISDEVLEAYSQIDVEDSMAMARLGIPLMTPRIKTLDGVHELSATGFSSAKMMAILTREIELPIPSANNKQ